MPLPRVAAILAIIASIFGALNTAEFLTLIGPKAGALVAVVGTVIAAVSRALTDHDGDGFPG